jgi:hypothetical protein
MPLTMTHDMLAAAANLAAVAPRWSATSFMGLMRPVCELRPATALASGPSFNETPERENGRGQTFGEHSLRYAINDCVRGRTPQCPIDVQRVRAFRTGCLVVHSKPARQRPQGTIQHSHRIAVQFARGDQAIGRDRGQPTIPRISAKGPPGHC